MYKRLKIENRNPICSIATIHDHLCLNGYNLSDKLIFLACLTSFFIDANVEVKEFPFFLIAPVENGIDLELFKRIGFEIENIDLKVALENADEKNIIAYFDYYSLLSKDKRIKKYNICPVHTTLIIERCDKGWMINEVKSENGEKEFTIRNKENMIRANNIELYPYPVMGIAYRILPQFTSEELENRIISIVDENLKNIVRDAEQYRGPVWDGKLNIFYGVQAYDELIEFFYRLQQEYAKGVTTIQNRSYGIMLMAFRRFLLPLSGNGDFFRSEMAEAFEYYAKYKKNKKYELVSKKLKISASEWKELGHIIISISTKKDKLPDLSCIVEKIKRIKSIELEAIDELKKII